MTAQRRKELKGEIAHLNAFSGGGAWPILPPDNKPINWKEYWWGVRYVTGLLTLVAYLGWVFS